MKVSELIRQLQALEFEHSDVEVFTERNEDSFIEDGKISDVSILFKGSLYGEKVILISSVE